MEDEVPKATFWRYSDNRISKVLTLYLEFTFSIPFDEAALNISYLPQSGN